METNSSSTVGEVALPEIEEIVDIDAVVLKADGGGHLTEQQLGGEPDLPGLA